MGADNTTLLVSNGKKIWNRNVPLGGNHFTRALTKEMKLTFAKAEHLKCNATKSPDPKAVFQALRPVFNDYVAEIQRSIGFFSSVNRDAKIGRIIGVGNGFKLAGLQKFLQQNLQMDVERVDSFLALAGDTVLNAPLFQENLLSFAVPYGLALQGLKITRVHTSLLPPEITTARLIRRKKPWAVATAAVLLAGLSISTLGYSHVWSAVSEARFGDAEAKAKKVVDEKGSMKSKYDTAKSSNQKYRKDLESLVIAGAERTPWLEVYKAINECLPRDRTIAEQAEENPTLKNRIRLLGITTKKYDNLDEWYKTLDESKKKYMTEEDRKKGPTWPGYVFTLQGRHFHDDPKNIMMTGVSYVDATLLRNLHQWAIPEFDSSRLANTGVIVPVRQLGISHATIADSQPIKDVKYYKNGPGAAAAGGSPGFNVGGATMPAMQGVRGMRGGRPAATGKGAKAANKPARLTTEEPSSEDFQPIPMTDFTIEFAWHEIPPEKREANDPTAPVAAAQPGAPQGANAAPPAAPGQPQATIPPAAPKTN